MRKILFATTNQSKINRFQKDLLEEGMEMISLKDIDIFIDVEENGLNAIENAILKAKAYSEKVEFPVIAMDDSLYLEGVPESLQPGLFVRRVQGKRLNDQEMISHYISLVKKYGKKGKITARWIYGIAYVLKDSIKTYTWSKEDFYLVDTPSKEIHEGYPLDSISIHKKLNKYFSEITDKDKESIQEDEKHVCQFIINSFNQTVENKLEKDIHKKL